MNKERAKTRSPRQPESNNTSREHFALDTKLVPLYLLVSRSKASKYSAVQQPTTHFEELYN